MWLYDTFLRYFRALVRLLPLSVRQFIVKTTLRLPLFLSRFVLNMGTIPILDDKKWIHRIEKNSWKGVWIVSDSDSEKQAEDEALNSDLVVCYAHGGGYCRGTAGMYMETFQLIISHLQSEHNILSSILSLEYSLSPEYVWPKACDEMMGAYQYLTDTVGVPPSKIFFAGDSAGGNLAAVAILKIKSQKGLSQPAGAVLFSPWVDLTINQPSFLKYTKDYMTAKTLESAVGCYIQNFNNLSESSKSSIVQNQLISPLYGDFSSTCPIFLSYGEKELLRASIEDFKLKLEKDGVNVTTLMGKNEQHIWLVYSLVASSKASFETDCKIATDWMASIVTGSSSTVKEVKNSNVAK